MVKSPHGGDHHRMVRLNPSDGVISNQKGDRADNRHEETVQVESVHTGGSEEAEQPASHQRADNSQQDVKYNALASPVHNLYFNPEHEEFAPRTLWSLSNAFTSALKQLDPIPQFRATAKLAPFLEARMAG